VDVEGSEYSILRRLIESGVLCRRVTDVFVEWHDLVSDGRRLPLACLYLVSSLPLLASDRMSW